MFPLDATTHQFEAVELLGIPGLFTTERVSRATVPPGLYLYEMQTGERDWTQPALLARRITVEHYGTVLTASPITLPESGYLDLKPGDFDEFEGMEHLTVAEFEAKYLPPREAPPSRQPSRARHAPVR